ncbi:MAG TPA: tRNA pseudouridine(38-40) synthase TruA [Rubrivivax sp.]|jgi:tRNA pseudouridine38-40 synthase|nr:tRNA pseudouridine(38-40) synthase TruA [Rubrivivax sp.]
MPWPEGGRGRIALGVAYRGGAYRGWQSQPGGETVQDKLEQALAAFLGQAVRVHCAGRTDAGVHALNQVVHLDAAPSRALFSWVRGTNRFLPRDIAVQWARPVAAGFHARHSAVGRRYRYVVRESPARPAIEQGLCGWVFRPLDATAMRQAAACLIGEHDFSAFRASGCQAQTPVKQLRGLTIDRRGAYWQFEFDASAFVHHMVRNIMGCLVTVGSGRQPASWVAHVLASRAREEAAPTFPPDGLYFVGPYYDSCHEIPQSSLAEDWLPLGGESR